MIKEYGYEYDASLDEELYKKTKGLCTRKLYDGAIALRSGRDALKVIAREYSPCDVLLPALSCDSMVLPFKSYGHNVIYYKLNEDYSINIDDLVGKIDGSKSHEIVLLYMDYFGNTAITDDQLEKLKDDKRIIFVEDRTHNYISNRTSEFAPDYIMASVRKWTNIPDGGLLWSQKPLNNNEFAEDTTFADTRLKAQCMRREYLLNGDESLKEEFRTIFSSVSDIIDEDREPARMSEYAYQLLRNTDWDEIKKKRQLNAEEVATSLKNYGIKLIQEDSSLSSLYVPILIEDRTKKQDKLSKKGIFNTIIWPLYEEQKEECQIVKYTEEHMLAVTCDQRYSQEEMKIISREIGEIVNA